MRLDVKAEHYHNHMLKLEHAIKLDLQAFQLLPWTLGKSQPAGRVEMCTMLNVAAAGP